MDQQSEYKVKAPKKLIEVALPLKEINEACVREKSIRHGHPSTLHLYWARRPLAAARAVLFAQLVNDPGWDEELQLGYKRKADANRKREELFEIIRELVKWENTNNEIVLEKARVEIRKSWKVTCELNKDHPQAAELFNPDKLPAFHDPFAGGGSIPLEAQRLGLEAWASDLNPVAVLINKAMIEIPPKFVGHRPIGPIPESDKQTDTESYTWPGVTGLAEDVRRYTILLRQEAFKILSQYFPKYLITSELVSARPDLKQYENQEVTVIAWIWARTVKSQNMRFNHIDVPLASTFVLSSKSGKEAYIEPIINDSGYYFTVKIGRYSKDHENGTKLARGAKFRCLMSNTPMDDKYIKSEGVAGRMGSRLMAIVAEGNKGRIYLPPTPAMEQIAQDIKPNWKPDQKLPNDLRAFWTPLYGLTHFYHLFTNRQLITLSTLSDIAIQIRDKVKTDAINAGLIDDNISLEDGGIGADAYADAMLIYLSSLIDQFSNQSSTLCGWNNINQQMIVTFSRQALPTAWDYAECNVFSNSSGSYNNLQERQYKGLLSLPSYINSFSVQADASTQHISNDKIISTDPPYYDNIGYADLSDFFYVWLRKTLCNRFPSLFSTIEVPKTDELIAAPYRHGSKANADNFFLFGMMKALSSIAIQANECYPIAIYYAFKQSETKETGVYSKGWVTFLQALHNSSLQIVGTWPLKTESANKLKASVNALASSIIMICRQRPSTNNTISRKEFLQELNCYLPIALDSMININETSSPIAPVDLAQAAIGPGMAVFSKYKSVVEADGSPMSVRTALILINKAIDDYFKELEGDWDSDTRFCLAWFSEYGWKEGIYGEADVLARAKGISVEGVRDSGVLAASSGKVKLLRPNDYPDNWNPAKDTHMPVWEALHHLIRLHQTRGESAAAEIVKAIPQIAETARQLAFLLYTTCERKGWSEDARPYNDLVTAWLSIEKQARADEQGDQIEAEF